MTDQFDPDWYFEHALIDAEPGGSTTIPRGPVHAWHGWWRAQSTPDEPVRTAAGQGFVLLTSQLAELGVSRSAGRTAVRAGVWTAPARGAIAPLDIRDTDSHLMNRRRHALRCSASLLRRENHAVTACSAAILHGLPTMDVSPQPETVTLGVAPLGHRHGAHVYGAAVGPDSLTRWHGVPVTTVARTVVDLARHDRRDGVIAADAALRERLVRSFDTELADAAGWPGVAAAREIVALATPEAESPLESLTRLALHDSGFPPPRLQYGIGRYHVDLCWPELRLVLEVDGRGKYVGDANWTERKRERALRAAGYRIERVTWVEVVHDWPATAAALRRYFR